MNYYVRLERFNWIFQIPNSKIVKKEALFNQFESFGMVGDFTLFLMYEQL